MRVLLLGLLYVLACSGPPDIEPDYFEIDVGHSFGEMKFDPHRFDLDTEEWYIGLSVGWDLGSRAQSYQRADQRQAALLGAPAEMNDSMARGTGAQPPPPVSINLGSGEDPGNLTREGEGLDWFWAKTIGGIVSAILAAVFGTRAIKKRRANKGSPPQPQPEQE